MDVTGEAGKTKALAVFENVVTKERKRKRKKFKTHRFSDDESSPSESELVIDDEAKEEQKKKRPFVRIRNKEELLEIKCEWNNCCEVFSDMEIVYKHLISHVEEYIDIDLKCQWINCPNPDNISSYEMLTRHLMYHGYLTKLINIGKNVLNRNNFPECSLEKKYFVKIPTSYRCEWEGCDNLSFNTIFDFLWHVECHINAAPSGKASNSKGTLIPCHWKGCNGKYSTRYKQADHIKVHTKEKTIACPQCMALFSSKTIFSDHRRRQLKTDMRSYQCSQCLKLFSHERLLSDHMRSHINQYKCTLCDMTSTKPSMLAKHYRFRHMDTRPFSCQTCSKTFVTKSNLNAHMLTHQETPFKCDQCEFGCKSKVGLRSHMNKVHGLESAIYECQVCKDQFKRGDYLTYHLIKQHKFHWPSGHCRFRYRKDSDGIHRLQTVRYESLEVTEQMIKSESMQYMKNPRAVTYDIKYEHDTEDFVTCDEPLGRVSDSEQLIVKGDPNLRSREGAQLIITIEDVDEFGNVIHTREVEVKELVVEEKNVENQLLMQKKCYGGS